MDVRRLDFELWAVWGLDKIARGNFADCYICILVFGQGGHMMRRCRLDAIIPQTFQNPVPVTSASTHLQQVYTWG